MNRALTEVTPLPDNMPATSYTGPPHGLYHGNGATTEGGGQSQTDPGVTTEGGGQSQTDLGATTEGGGQSHTDLGATTEGGGQ